MLIRHLSRFLYPMILSYARTLTTICRSPTLLLSNNIQFEDVLGRHYSLEWEHFKHWKVSSSTFRSEIKSDVIQIFRSFLEVQFEDCAGEDEVVKEQYRILDARSYGEVLDRRAWGNLVPGMKLVMSIMLTNISHLETEMTRCPRGCETKLVAQQNYVAVW